jgi:hypothetical protein
VVLGGHTHSELVERIDGTLLTRPGVNGRVLLEVALPDREVTHHEVADGPLDAAVRDVLAERMLVLVVDSDPAERHGFPPERCWFQIEALIFDVDSVVFKFHRLPGGRASVQKSDTAGPVD